MEPMRFSTGRDALDATIKRAFSIRSAAGLWKCGQGKRLDHSPTGEQKQKKRTFDVLPNPAKLISYRHSEVEDTPRERMHNQVTSWRRDRESGRFDASPDCPQSTPGSRRECTCS